MKAMRALIVIVVAAAMLQLASAGCATEFMDCSGDKDPCALIRCKEGYNCRVDNCGSCHGSCEAEGMVHIMSMPDVPDVQENTSATDAVSPDAPVLVRRNTPGVDKPVPKPAAPNTATNTGTGCPPGVSTVNCLVDPCSTKKCGANQTCESNYCGGCNAVCKPKATTATAPKPASNNSNVAKPTPAANAANAACPPGVATVKCLTDPCTTAKCGTNEVCQSNYCGGCNAVCKPKAAPAPSPKPASNNVPKPTPAGTAASAACPPGVTTVNCFVDPCTTAKCGTNQTCESNYCGGCNAVCKAKPAEPASTAANSKCPYAPCIATLCAANTTCVDDLVTCTAKCVPAGNSSNTPPVKCKAGHGWNAKLNACLLCKPGSVANAKTNKCVLCGVDTYWKSTVGSKQCMKCPEGKTTKGKKGQLVCVDELRH